MNKLKIAAGIFAFASILYSANLSVNEIVNKTNKVAYYQGNDGRADV